MLSLLLLLLTFVLGLVLALPTVHTKRQEDTSDSNQVIMEAHNEWGNATGIVVRLFGFEGRDQKDSCGNVQKGWRQALIIQGIEDMMRMMPVVTINTPDFDSPGFPRTEYVIDWNSAAAIEYLGSEIRSGSYRPSMQKNFNRLGGLERSGIVGAKLHVRCDDPANDCGIVTDAYVAHGVANGENLNDNINFCKNYFFGQDSLDNTVNKVASGATGKNRENLMSYRDRATVWAHELLHVSWIGQTAGVDRAWMTDELYGTDTRPFIAYTATQCKYLAGSDSSPEYSTVNNPQSYMYVALANYIVKTKDFYPSENTWTLADDPPGASAPSILGPGEPHDVIDSCPT